MARQLFINDTLINDHLALVDGCKSLEPSDFWEHTFLPLKEVVKEQIKSCSESKEFLETLYFMGSFSRGMAGLSSDLDLLSTSNNTRELESFNLKMRTVFRSYSLKHVKSVEDFVGSSDQKGLLSGWFLSPVLGGLNIQKEIQDLALELRCGDIEEFLSLENKKRRKRYGDRSGRIHYNIKYGPGGLMDLFLLMWRRSWDKKNILVSDQILNERALFLYKAKTLIYRLSQSESLQLVDVKKYAKSFGFFSEQEFFQKFFTVVHEISHLLEYKKTSEVKFSVKNLLKRVADPEEIASAEAKLAKVRGFVLSPSYHIWTVDQHILTCILEVQNFIEIYKKKLDLSLEDEAVLQWASFFHDLEKGGAGSHSVLGARSAQEFGKKHAWTSERTELVSWLVREHLTLVKQSFKADPYHEDFVRNLAIRGCEGRRAKLLFVLTCADIKATNPSTWNEWKCGVLEGALNRILGVKETVKEDLQKELGLEEDGSEGMAVLGGLSVKEICMVPYGLLLEDLKGLNQEGFAFYEHRGKYWVRAYFNSDEFGFAEKFVQSFVSAGAYIHHAVFKTLQTQGGKKAGAIYNWICCESGASLNAFRSRFSMAYGSYEASQSERALKPVNFKRIRRTFLRESYAVISFKGSDEAGALVSAIKILKGAGLGIEWGHAVTWGEEIEDVFGVSFSESPDWTFLSRESIK